MLRIVAVFTRHAELFPWARAQVEQAWGPIALQSDTFAFDFSTYYEREMGAELQKVFWACERLFDPAALVDAKQLANQWEAAAADQPQYRETRPLNVDPGYLTEAKLILASTKDRDHRIYLREGIFCECTLYYYHGCWRERPWTYPDYAAPASLQFFDRCRQYLRDRYRDRR